MRRTDWERQAANSSHIFAAGAPVDSARKLAADVIGLVNDLLQGLVGQCKGSLAGREHTGKCGGREHVGSLGVGPDLCLCKRTARPYARPAANPAAMPMCFFMSIPRVCSRPPYRQFFHGKLSPASPAATMAVLSRLGGFRTGLGGNAPL